MQYQEVLALVNAGYTRAEIEAMQAQPAPMQPQGVTPLPLQQLPLIQPMQTPQQPVQPVQSQAAPQVMQQPAQPLPLQQPALPLPQQTIPAAAFQTAQDRSNADAQALLLALTRAAQAQQPQQVQQAQQPQQVQQAQPAQDAQQILRALGGLAAGIALPTEAETLEDRMGNTLMKALGIKPAEEKK